MGDQVVDGGAHRCRDLTQRPDLVKRQAARLIRGDFHLAPAEAVDVRQAPVHADGNVVLLGERYGALHVHGIARVKAAGHVDRREMRDDLGVGTEGVVAEALAHVAVDVHRSLHVPCSFVPLPVG